MFDYGTYHAFPGWDAAPTFIGSIIDRERSESVLEIGGGANPTIPLDEVRARGLRYTTNDVSAEELAKADPRYQTLCLDMSATLPPSIERGTFDLVFSRMVNEHVVDGSRYYRNIHELLATDGLTAHCSSTLYAFPFLVNRLLPEAVSDRLLASFNPRDLHQQGKFRAYYSWCRGPSKRMVARFNAIGFTVEDYRGYFGHPYYGRVPWLQGLEEHKARWLVTHPVGWLTSYMAVILRKAT